MYDELVKNLRKVESGEYCAVASTEDFPVMQFVKDAADVIEDLDNRLNLHRQGKIGHWIPVTERLPEDGAEVLAWSQSGFAYVDWWIDGAWKVNSLVDGKYEFVTHWMPLPQTPKDGES